MRRIGFVLACAVLVAGQRVSGQIATLPRNPDSLKLAVIGDNGTGDAPQFELARVMLDARAAFPFDLVLMLGDNLYGKQDYVQKFEQPYKALLDAGVLFQAALGNHDTPEQRFYRPFNMGGQRYYTFTRGYVRFVVLDTNALDAAQLAWCEATLKAANERWKIVFFHHPIYGNAGRHGGAADLRVLLEPLLVANGVHLVLSGHDHVYERLKPQKGIHYFVAGSSGQLRKGDLVPSASTAAGFDRDQAFVLFEIEPAALYFEAITRTGARVDSGVIRRGPVLTTEQEPPER